MICANCWATFTPSTYARSGCCSRSCAIRYARGKLNAADVAAIREERAKGRTQDAIARAFGVSRNCIFRIVTKAGTP